MKQHTLLLTMGLNLSAVVYAQNAKPVEVAAPVDKIFIPSGFDDNDNVEVVLHGNFPDGCYSVGEATAKVDQANRVITVHATSLIKPEEYCVQSLTPFIQSVPLGNLAEGTW